MSANNNTQVKPTQFGDAVQFIEVVDLLEGLTNKNKTSQEKTAKVEKFISKCRNCFETIHGTLNSDAVAGGDSIFSVIRILMLKEDRERATYNMGAITLGRLLAAVLSLNNKDKEKLTKFRNQSVGQNEIEAEVASNFSNVVHGIMASRFSNRPPSQLSLSGFNAILDKLSISEDTDQKVQKEVLFELFAKKEISPKEAKWLCRILLKDLEIDVKQPAIFRCIHPKARDMFLRISDLKKVCQQLNDPNADVDVEKIELTCYVKPMLCLRVNTLDDFGDAKQGTSSALRNKQKSTGDNEKTRMEPPYCIETKWDGERFQIHYDGRALKYLSKKGHDFSERNYNASLTPRFLPQIKPGVKSFIIDGEMMAWQKKYNKFTQKGSDVDVKTLLPSNPNHCAVFVAFDVLLYNGETIINKPFLERTEILKKILIPKEGSVLVPEPKIVETREQVEAALNKAIDDLEEGLVIKSIDSTYMPGQRKNAWRKLKPEFIYGSSVDDLDLLILGAYYSDSLRRGGQIGNFLVGVMKKTKDKEEFYALTQVGSGQLRMLEMGSLIEELKPHFQKKEFPNINYKASLRPALFIDPKKSIVVQVKASEIIQSDSFALNYNLRFPRITRVRRDKNYNEVMTVAEFHELREACKGKLVKRTDGKSSRFSRASSKPSSTIGNKRKSQHNSDSSDNDNDSEDDDEPASKRSFNNTNNDMHIPSPTKKPQNSTIIDPVLSSASFPVQRGKPVVKKDIFNSKVFQVIGPPITKNKLEHDIASYGGEIVQNPVKEKFYVVGVMDKRWNGVFKVKKAIDAIIYDVLKPEWIEKCIKKGLEIPFTPEDFHWYYSDDTRAVFRNEYDKFGDSYTKSLSLDEVKTLVQRMKIRSEILEKAGVVEEKMNEDDEDDTEEMDSIEDIRKELDSELFPGELSRKINQYRFFTDVKVAFRGPNDEVLADLIKFYGGTVIDTKEDDEGATHIIVECTEDTMLPSIPAEKKPFLVKIQWIKDCLKQRERLDELAYSS